MARMVLLMHTLPDGSRHFDWLIEPVAAGPGSVEARLNDLQDDPDEACLMTFRVSERIDTPNVKAFDAALLPLHRRAYLSYQGPVHGGAKGEVRRVCSGMVRRVGVMGHEKDGIIDAVMIRGKFAGGLEYTWAGVRLSSTANPPVVIQPKDAWSGLWQFKRSTANMVQGGSRPDGIDDTPSSYGEWSMTRGWML